MVAFSIYGAGSKEIGLKEGLWTCEQNEFQELLDKYCFKVEEHLNMYKCKSATGKYFSIIQL